MEVIISIVGSLAAKAAEYVVDPTARQLSYLFKHKTKFLNLRTKVRDLEDARQRLQQSAEAATRNGEVIFDDVQRWLTEANEKISEEAATQLQEDEVKATKRCFAGFCPNFKSRYHLSKKADREANAIAQLLTKKDAFNAVGYLPAVEVIDIIRPVKEYEAFASRNGAKLASEKADREADAIAQLLTEKDAFKEVSYLPAIEVIDIIRPVKEYEAFGSRSCAFNEVMEALEDDAVSIIGVYGMGGVGKTTLVKEAAKQANEKQLFTEVVLVSIKQKPNMRNIQKEIAEKLGMTLSEDNINVRAARLCERLKAKRILVVLDDIWESLELEALGIPSGDEHKGCKILVTSRRLDVLESLNSQPNISIETLKEDEAWTLFKKMAGLVEGSDFQSTAVEVAKRCAGLPIAIATVAKALKPKKNLFEWKDALQQLSQPSERNFKGIPKDAYLAIELSYRFLDAEELGPIFLLCSIMGHDADPEDLLRDAIGLGFIHDLNAMEARRNRILTLVNNLKASCLLLEGSDPNRFDMHDVVRDVAQSIALRDLHWLALTKEWPDEEKMKESQLISLQNVEEMEVRECRAVEILFASGETSSEQPLFWVNESTFPNLHELTLESNAGMKEMIWHCQGQQQHQLPSPYFPNLKVVTLHQYPKQVTVLPSYLFHLLSLPTLQTLEISRCSFKEMIFQSEEGGEEKPASLLLSQITELWLDDLTELMHLWKEKEGFPNLRFLYVQGCSGLKANLVPFSVSFLNLVTLKVERCHGIVKLITHSTAKSLVQLKQMCIQNCENIEEIIQGEDDDDEISFPHLNRLELEYLPKLESFCSLEKYTFEFRSLEILVVHNCPNMKMFSKGDSHTPLLHNVRFNKYGSEVRWEGSLNSTIQELCREKKSLESWA